MPAVSTMTRSNPDARQAAIASPSAAEISLPVARVASERMKVLRALIAFMRMRSPSSAPPPAPARGGPSEPPPILHPAARVEPEAPYQLVGERALPCSAGAGNSEYRSGIGPGFFVYGLLLVENTQLERGDDLGKIAQVAVRKL